MIIWLASYPKSGNTWLRAILSTLEFSQDGIFKPEYLNKIYAFPSFTHMKRVTEKIKDVHELKKNWIKAQDLINLDNKKKFVKVAIATTIHQWCEFSMSLLGSYT